MLSNLLGAPDSDVSMLLLLEVLKSSTTDCCLLSPQKADAQTWAIRVISCILFHAIRVYCLRGLYDQMTESLGLQKASCDCDIPSQSRHDHKISCTYANGT